MQVMWELQLIAGKCRAYVHDRQEQTKSNPVVLKHAQYVIHMLIGG